MRTHVGTIVSATNQSAGSINNQTVNSSLKSEATRAVQAGSPLAELFDRLQVASYVRHFHWDTL